MGLIGAATPFLNGKPRTLFYRDQILTSGLIGIALKNTTKLDMVLHSESLVPISSRLDISRCQGNIILELANQNATKTLLKYVHSSAIQSNDSSLFMRVYNGQVCYFKKNLIYLKSYLGAKLCIPNYWRRFIQRYFMY